MKPAFLLRSHNNVWLPALFALIAAGVLALAAVDHARPALTSYTATTSAHVSGANLSPPQPLRGISAERQHAVEAEMIALRPSGFEPAEITRPAGRFLLAVSDQTGLEGVRIQLSTGEKKVHEARLSGGRRLWRKVVDLAPGEYRLTEVSHPDRVCLITVTR